MKILYFFLGVIIISVCPAVAQVSSVSDSSVHKAMRKMHILTGNWVGSGWINTGKEKRTFTQREMVVQKVKGTAIVIDGIGLDEITRKPVHEAFAVISYDIDNKKYMIRAFLANGKYIDADISVKTENTIMWSYKHPQAGKIRYTISVVNSNWVEKGEMNRDGSYWVPFFQMDLKKQD